MSDLIERIDAAMKRIADGHAPMRIPADPTDLDLVLLDCRAEIDALKADREQAARVCEDLMDQLIDSERRRCLAEAQAIAKHTASSTSRCWLPGCQCDFCRIASERDDLKAELERDAPISGLSPGPGYTLADVDNIEAARGKPYQRLREVVAERVGKGSGFEGREVEFNKLYALLDRSNAATRVNELEVMEMLKSFAELAPVPSGLTLAEARKTIARVAMRTRDMIAKIEGRS